MSERVNQRAHFFKITDNVHLTDRPPVSLGGKRSAWCLTLLIKTYLSRVGAATLQAAL
jgi:hypothetical protein